MRRLSSTRPVPSPFQFPACTFFAQTLAHWVCFSALFSPTLSVNFSSPDNKKEKLKSTKPKPVSNSPLGKTNEGIKSF